MLWRFGADLGTNSLGWAAVELNQQTEPIRLVAAGSRIFSDGRDPQSGASLAVDRRDARAMRRRRDRFKQRQHALLKYLTRAGLFPDSREEGQKLAALDPYALRARALDEKLSLHEIGRALFHLNQRRGFKSNRKAGRKNDKEDGKIRSGVGRLHEAMVNAGADTLGQFLHMRRTGSTDQNAIAWVRARMADDASEGYNFYPGREMLEDEFDRIWREQATHHPDVLTDENRALFHEIIFHQRPLKAPRIGMCTLVAGEERLPKRHPLFQTRRLLEELNALRIVRTGQSAAPLTLDERNTLYLKLRDKKSVTYASLRKALKLDAEARFNKESESRKDMKGDEIFALFSDKKCFGSRWGHLTLAQQWDVISHIENQQSDADERALEDWLQHDFGLTTDQARHAAALHLPEGYGRFGLTATTKLIEALRAEVIVYSEAVQKAGLGHHSDLRTGEYFVNGKGEPELPYYGQPLERFLLPGSGDPDEKDLAARYGRLTNPTVHIALNQLRTIFNDLIKRFGPPAQACLEVARELKLDDKRKKEINTRNKLNREAAVKRSEKLTEINQRDKGGNRTLLKLWEELNPDNVLDRRCIYTGRQISIDMLFNGMVEVDHILPFSATLDDSGGNRLICMAEANRFKRKRSPFEAYGNSPEWEAIAARASALPREKRWRFEPDALTRFDATGGFLARQLTDTQYLARLARDYLAAFYPGAGEGSGKVWVTPGRLTEMLRRSWQLNHLLPDHNLAGGTDQPKNRKDHRHHAIDAIVIAVTDRGLLQRIARESGQRGHVAANRLTADLPVPWEGFENEVATIVQNIKVSHKPDHGTVAKTNARRDTTAGRLHNNTAYGLTGLKDEKGNDLVVHRAPLLSIKKRDGLSRIRDEGLRAALINWTEGLEGKAFEARLAKFRELGPLAFRNIRRVRIIEPLSVIAIKDAEGRAYKGYKGDSNYRYDVWALKDGKWIAEVISMFEAHQPGWESAIKKANPTARKVLRLHQDDVIAIDNNGGSQLMRIVKFGQSGQITLAAPHESGDLKRRDASPNEEDPFKYVAPTASGLKRMRARQVRIDATGRVFDPGPRES